MCFSVHLMAHPQRCFKCRATNPASMSWRKNKVDSISSVNDGWNHSLRAKKNSLRAPTLVQKAKAYECQTPRLSDSKEKRHQHFGRTHSWSFNMMALQGLDLGVSADSKQTLRPFARLGSVNHAIGPKYRSDRPSTVLFRIHEGFCPSKAAVQVRLFLNRTYRTTLLPLGGSKMSFRRGRRGEWSGIYYILRNDKRSYDQLSNSLNSSI